MKEKQEICCITEKTCTNSLTNKGNKYKKKMIEGRKGEKVRARREVLTRDIGNGWKATIRKRKKLTIEVASNKYFLIKGYLDDNDPKI